MSSEGSRITEGADGGGWREFLCDRPLHAGDGIQIWAGGHWLPVRYETQYDRRRGVVYCRLFDPDGRYEAAWLIDRATMLFRWPPAQGDGRANAEELTRAHQRLADLRSDLRDLRGIARSALRDAQEDPELDKAQRYEGALEQIVADISRMQG